MARKKSEENVEKTVKKNLGGRPTKYDKIDKNQFENMCQIQCTKDEICAIFEINEQTLTKWCEETYNMSFCDIYKSKSSGGKMSLRRQQFAKAEEGNTTMLIWLGKQYLGQTDKIESKNENTDTNDKVFNKLKEALKNG